MKIVYKKYSQHYESQLLKLWNKCLTVDSISINMLRSKMLFDENYDENLCIIATDQDRLVGICYGVKRKFPYLERGLEPKKGWISFIMVDVKYRRRGIGSKLLEQVENKLINLKTKEIIVASYSPNYFFSGVNQVAYHDACLFFEKHKYQKSKMSYAMSKNLTRHNLSKDTLAKLKGLKKKGFHFQMFTYDYANELLQFALKEFGAGWKRNCLLGMQYGRMEDVTFLALDKNNKIVGFCTRMIDGDPTRFGPIGVAEKVRNEGIGGVLFDLALIEMKKRGLKRMHFLSTEENGKRFYLRHGLTVDKNQRGYHKFIK